MSPPAAPSQALFRQLVRETDESAAVSLLHDLCRGSRALRVWLFEEFGRDEAVRAAYARRLKGQAPLPGRFADLDGVDTPWRDETRRLRARFSGQTYGGLTFDQLQELIVRHQAGHADAAAFLLAVEWRRCKEVPPPRLVRATCDFFVAVLQPGGAELLRDLARTVELTEAFADRRRLRAALGFSDWWKLSVLMYLLRHPALSYRTRDLHRHLISEGLQVSPRALRQFCTEHGIARDRRAGRPAAAASLRARSSRSQRQRRSHR